MLACSSVLTILKVRWAALTNLAKLQSILAKVLDVSDWCAPHTSKHEDTSDLGMKRGCEAFPSFEDIAPRDSSFILFNIG